MESPMAEVEFRVDLCAYATLSRKQGFVKLFQQYLIKYCYFEQNGSTLFYTDLSTLNLLFRYVNQWRPSYFSDKNKCSLQAHHAR